ncbi:uncharacterized protein [Choristoneura fumiferana]|uniref:uncharacterized protein n=1 Tax=Choristoneura fumiferana TaxID=7141 RepID=UPI003D1550A9
MDLGIQLAALIICACAVSSEDIPDLEDSIPRFEQICDLFAKDSYFRPNHLVEGKRWRIYYTWNIEMRDRCVDMTFEWATVAATQRLWSDMHEYLETEPPWEAALLLMTMGSRDHQMMLFPDQGPAGRMLGVPNVRRDANVLIPKKSVPLLKFQMRIMNINLQPFLVVMDCITAVTTLSVKADVIPPYKEFYHAASLQVPYPYGKPSCIEHQQKFTEHYKKDYEI